MNYLADCGASGSLSAAETIGPERAKVAVFWAPEKTAKSARTLGNPNEYAGLGEKKPKPQILFVVAAN